MALPQRASEPARSRVTATTPLYNAGGRTAIDAHFGLTHGTPPRSSPDVQVVGLL